MKLHLGCGDIFIPGYVHVDIVPDENVDAVADLRALPFADASAELIYNCAVLEHFGRVEWKPLLKNWFQLLKPGGILRTSTNDFEAAIVQYGNRHDMNELLGILIGGQKTPYDWHGMIFDFQTLRGGLEEVGFTNIRRYDWRETELGQLGIDDYSQAYLPHMDKENGRLMMLNVEATRPR